MTCCALIDVLFPDDRRRNVDCLASQDRHQAVSISKYLRVLQSISGPLEVFHDVSGSLGMTILRAITSTI